MLEGMLHLIILLCHIIISTFFSYLLIVPLFPWCGSLFFLSVLLPSLVFCSVLFFTFVVLAGPLPPACRQQSFIFYICLLLPIPCSFHLVLLSFFFNNANSLSFRFFCLCLPDWGILGGILFLSLFWPCSLRWREFSHFSLHSFFCFCFCFDLVVLLYW